MEMATRGPGSKDLPLETKRTTLYRPLLPDSEIAHELWALTRDRADLVRTRTMLSNHLTSCRKAYFPEFLTRFVDPDRPGELALLQACPTREALQAMSSAQLEMFLRRQRCPRSRDRAAEIHARECGLAVFTSRRPRPRQGRAWQGRWRPSCRRLPSILSVRPGNSAMAGLHPSLARGDVALR